MKEIERINLSQLSKKFGLEPTSKHFIFKPLEHSSTLVLQPHRSEMYSLGIVVEGEAEFRVGLEKYHVKAPGLVAVPPDQVRQWLIKESGIKTISVFFKEDFVVSGMVDTFFLRNFYFFKKAGLNFIALNDVEFSSIKMLFDQIEKKNNSDFPGKGKSIQALLRVLLLEAGGLQEMHIKKTTEIYSRGHRLTEEFKEILAEKFIEERSVGFYAEKLFVTPKHLSQTIKEQTGKTASSLINEMVSLEAKVLLQRKESSISEISDYLNFASPSFFGKFFKRNSGMSPLQFRKNLL